jgi:hypothetical protein
MANNQDDKVVDLELEKAQKSMAGRIDPEPIAPKEEVIPPVEPKKEDKQDVTPAPKVDNIPPEDKKPDIDPPADPIKKVNRPEAYIPMPKYLSEKQENDRILADKEAKLTEALKKVEELTALAGKKDGDQKDEDIENFMAETGFDRATVDGFLKLAEKKLLKPERLEAIKKAEMIVTETEIEEQFNAEFSKFGEPELKKRYPNITEAGLEKAKKLLDQVSHTADFSKSPLDFIIYKHSETIEKLIADDSGKKDDLPPQTKRTIESNHPGNGKNTNVLTAKDFEGQTDFSALNDMEPSERSQLIKSFPTKTYENFVSWTGSQEKGIEVMRNGQRVMLK